MSTDEILSTRPAQTASSASASDVAALTAAPGDSDTAESPPLAASSAASAAKRSVLNLASVVQNGLVGAGGMRMPVMTWPLQTSVLPSMQAPIRARTSASQIVLGHLRGALGVTIGEVSSVRHGRQVQRRGGQSGGKAMLHQGVEKCVGGGICGLTSVADGTGRGRDGDEEVERGRVGGKGVVEVPGACDLGLDDGGVVGLLDLTSGRTAAGEKDNIAGTVVDHPLGHAATETTGSTDEQVGAVRSKDLLGDLGGGGLEETQKWNGCRQTYHDLVVGAQNNDRLSERSLGALDSILDLRHGKDGSFHRSSLTLADQLGNIVNQPLEDGRTLSGQALNVNVDKRCVAGPMISAQIKTRRSLGDVDKTAKPVEAAPTLADDLGGKDNIYTLTGRRFSDGRPKACTAVENEILRQGELGHDQLLLGGRGHGDKHVGFVELGKADGRLANSTGSRVDEDTLAGRKSTLLHQSMIGSHIGQRQRRGLGKVHSLRDRDDVGRRSSCDGRLLSITGIHTDSLDFKLDLVGAKSVDHGVVDKVQRLATNYSQLATLLSKRLLLEYVGVGALVHVGVGLGIIQDPGGEQLAAALHKLHLLGCAQATVKGNLEHVQNGLGNMGVGGFGSVQIQRGKRQQTHELLHGLKLLLGRVGKERHVNLGQDDADLALGLDVTQCAHGHWRGGRRLFDHVGEGPGKRVLEGRVAVHDDNLGLGQRAGRFSRGAVDEGGLQHLLPLELVAKLARRARVGLTLTVDDGRNLEILKLDEQLTVLGGGHDGHASGAGLLGRLGKLCLAKSPNCLARGVGVSCHLAGDGNLADRGWQVDGVRRGATSAEDRPRLEDAWVQHRLGHVVIGHVDGDVGGNNIGGGLCVGSLACLDALESSTKSHAQLLETVVHVGLGNIDGVVIDAGSGFYPAANSLLLTVTVDLVVVVQQRGNLSRAMLSPATVLGPAGNAELPPPSLVLLGVRVWPQAYVHLDIAIAHGQGLGDDNAAQLEPVVLGLPPQGLLGGSLEGHGYKAGKGEDSQRLNAVVPQPWEVVEGHNVAPRRLDIGRVDGLDTNQVVAWELAVLVHLGHARLVPVFGRVVPHVARQISKQGGLLGRRGVQVQWDGRSRRGVEVTGEVDSIHVEESTLHEEVTGQVEGRVDGILVADQSRSVWELGTTGGSEDLLDGALKRRVGTDLDEGADTAVFGLGLEHTAESLGEADGAGQVLDPVGGSTLVALDALAKQRRVELDLRVPRLGQVLYRVAVLVGHEVHVVRVVGDVDLQLAAEHLRLLLLDDALEVVQHRGVTGDGQTGRTVEAGDADLVLLALYGINHGLHLGFGATDGHHAAGKIGEPGLEDGDQPTSVVGDGHGRVKVDDAGGIGGADLTGRVARDGDGRHAPGSEEVRDGQLDGCAGGLTDVCLGHLGSLSVLAQLLQQRPRSTELLEFGIGTVHGGRIDGIRVIELTAHTVPLSALTSKHESYPGGLGLRLGRCHLARV
ncbi:hypothetical protein PpBr36_05477 [Pyricularia pennisetigena]|uniref:hypothetical protein n=1 Tax=Pyricularia pennisetigena TaxID=1578925 RepID=UPI0011503D4C|nr:hypothetical protein PpBr36_05477 [Pyricularia pennisetigena]TLS26608.1 hypothetical protein PpBr36_05477 [Pyricularia pennisetigena]